MFDISVKWLLLLALMTGNVVFSLSAQDLPTDNTFRLSTLDNRLNGIYYLPQGKGQPYYLKISPSFISGPYDFVPGERVIIYRDNFQGERERVAVVDIPVSVKQPLLLLLEVPIQISEDEILPYQCIVLDDSRERAEINSIRFVNLSSYELAVSLDKSQPEMMKPQGELITPFSPPEAGDRYQPLRIAYREDAQTGWKPLALDHESELYLEDGLRLWVFIRPGLTGTVKSPKNRPLVFIPDMDRIPEKSTESPL